jgi:hypothetical protein
MLQGCSHPIRFRLLCSNFIQVNVKPVNEVTHSAPFPEFVSILGQFASPPEEQHPFLYKCMCQVLTYHIPRLLTRHYQDFLPFIRSPSRSRYGYFRRAVLCSCYGCRNINCTHTHIHVNNTSCSAYVFQYRRIAQRHLILDVYRTVNDSDDRQVCMTVCASHTHCVNMSGRHFEYFIYDICVYCNWVDTRWQ